MSTESIIYPNTQKCQAGSEISQGLKSPLGNLTLESSTSAPKSAESPLTPTEKRRIKWARHFAQKKFQQKQYSLKNKEIYYAKTAYSKLISEKYVVEAKINNISQLHFETTEAGKKETALVNKLKRIEKSLQRKEKEVETLQKQLKVFKHSAGVCGERVIPRFSVNKKKEVYETGCPGHAEIHTNYNEDSDKKAHYVFLRKCASVWFCMHCAEQIFIKRREEIETAFAFNKENSMSFVTLTNPHTIDDYFPDLMTRMQKALSAFRSGRAWKEFKEKYGFVGEIRTLETTFSKQAGFHPHYHSVYLYDHLLSDKEAKEVEKFVKDRWHHICKKHGFLKTKRKKDGHKIHGAVVKTGTDIVKQEYLSKTEIWELASTTSKTPRRCDSISHWTLQELAVAGDEYYQEKWSEFMIAMKGRIAIWWSQGLKEKVGLKNIIDEELVEGEVATKVMEITSGEMKLISNKQYNCKILEAVESSLLNNDSFIDELRVELDMRLEIDKPIPT